MHSTGKEIHLQRKEQPFLYISSVHQRFHLDQEAVCDTDAQEEYSLSQQHALLFLSGNHHGTAHLPGNRFLHIYLNRTVQYRIW